MTAGTIHQNSFRIDSVAKMVLRREASVAPPVGHEKLREWTGVLRKIVDEVRHGWDAMPPEAREWLRLWLADELPKPSLRERIGLSIARSVVNAAHPDNVREFLAEGNILRAAVLEKVAAEVYTRTLEDEDFAKQYDTGMREIAEGKGIRIAPE